MSTPFSPLDKPGVDLARPALPIGGRVGSCDHCGHLILLTREQMSHSDLPYLCPDCYDRQSIARDMD